MRSWNLSHPPRDKRREDEKESREPAERERRDVWQRSKAYRLSKGQRG